MSTNSMFVCTKTAPIAVCRFFTVKCLICLQDNLQVFEERDCVFLLPQGTKKILHRSQ